MVHQLNLFILIALLGLAFAPASYAAKNERLLDASGKRVVPIKVLPQWERILQNHPYENQVVKSVGHKQWLDFIASIKHEPKLRQMLRVNQWFKKYSYKLDRNVFGQDDYWASPVEFLQRGGDCEDYAIIKYMTLRALGFSAKDLKVAMVYDVYSGTDHSFLIVNHNNAEYVMDNREKVSVSRYLKKRYKMHYAFNEKTVWKYKRPVMARKVRSPNSQVLPGNR